MTVEDYDLVMSQNWAAIVATEEALKVLRRFADRLHRGLGITEHSRDPGFATWTHPKLSRYYNSPREIIEALEREGKS